jgi:hypothetical protein
MRPSIPPPGRVPSLNAAVLTKAAQIRYEDAAEYRSPTLFQSTTFHQASM